MTSKLAIKPFDIGAATHSRAIIRLRDEPRYLNVSASELAILQEMVSDPASSMEAYLSRHFSGQSGISFRDAITLLIKLHNSGFFTDAQIAGLSDVNKLGDLSRVSSHNRVLAALQAMAGKTLDVRLVSFDNTRVSPGLKAVGRALISSPALVMQILLGAVLGVTSEISAPSSHVASSLIEALSVPETALVRFSGMLMLAVSSLGVLRVAALAGCEVRYIPCEVRLTGLGFLRFVVDDEDAFMLSRKEMLRYRIFWLLTPWTAALACWRAAGKDSLNSMPGMTAAVFALLGMLSISPMFRSHLIKSVEGILASRHILKVSDRFLSSRVFAFPKFASRKSPRLGAAPKLASDAAFDQWYVIFATLSLGWLYAAALFFSDALLAMLPHLWAQMTSSAEPVRVISCAVLLALLFVAMSVPVLKLMMIPFQNAAALVSLPLQKARNTILSHYSPKVTPSAAVSAFLREVPLFNHLNDEHLAKLTTALRFGTYRQGQDIVRQGQSGQEFYVLGTGQAQVLVERAQGTEEVVDVLRPGDSFGEIALIDSVPRTATIRALTNVKALVLDKAQFDKLFPLDSQERQTLTRTIRLAKLVSDSKALSHLAPAQIRELLSSSSTVKFSGGETIIEEGATAEEAFLVESGNVRVVRGSDHEALAVLGRGDLVGAIALIRDIQRTARVVAVGDVTCLRIDRQTFLNMCRSNVFVAMLVSDLSEMQLAELKRAG